MDIKKRKAMSVEDVLEALKVIDGLGRFEELEQATLAKKAETPLGRTQQEILARLEEDYVRVVRKKPRKKKTLHPATRKVRRRAREFNKRVRERKHAMRKWAYIMDDPDDVKGWYLWFSKQYFGTRKNRKEWEITFEEYEEHLHPVVRGKLCTVSRYSTKKPWTLDNLVVREQDTGLELFDGSEHKLRQLGYIL